MKQFFSLFAALFLLAASGFSQPVNPSDTALLKANADIQTALVTRLNLPEKKAAKIIAIENGFYAKRAAIEAAQNTTAADREIKLGEAFRSRYGALMDIPLTGRQMEDAVEVVAQIRRVHKL